MALLLSPMSAIPHIQHHMTSAHGHSVPSNLSHNPSNAVTQSDSKRPKLSLQTTSLTSTYGSLTRGVAPNTTQGIYTPTTANTLSNTWDLAIRPSPVSRTESPRPLQQVRSQAGQQPYAYSLPFGVKPILKNSPLPAKAPSVSASPRDSRRKVFFPQPKRVSFRQNLEEVIETKQYVVKHSDLTSSEEESSGDESQGEATSLTDTDNASSTYHTSPPPNRKRKVRRDSGISIDTKTEASVPATATATATIDETTTDDNSTIKLPPPCKRRKWHPTSSFGGPLEVEKEGVALRRTPKTSEAELTSSPDEISSGQPLSEDLDLSEKENCEAHGGEECRLSSPLPVLEGLPDSKDSTIAVSESERSVKKDDGDDGLT